jgi:hypothetical protein
LLNECHVSIEGLDLLTPNEMQQEYDTILSQIEAGNNNPRLKQKLKAFILTAINERKLPMKQGLLMLAELD